MTQPFAAVFELGLYLHEDITTPEAEERAKFLLGIATRVVQSEVGQEIARVAEDEIVLVGGATDTLLLPEYPVTDLRSVSVDGDDLVDGDDYGWERSGVLWRLPEGTWWGTLEEPVAVEVTYDHGYDPVPEDVRGIVVSVAARMWRNPDAVQSEKIGGYSVAYDVRRAGPALTTAERRALDRYRSRPA